GRARVDEALKAVPARTAMTVAQAEQLRQQLIAAIADPSSGDRLVALPNSIFRDDPGMSDQERRAIADRFIDFLKIIKDQQDNKSNVTATNLPPIAAAAISGFQKWATPTPSGAPQFWALLVTRIQTASQTNQALATRVSARMQDFRNLAGLTGTALAAIGEG